MQCIALQSRLASVASDGAAHDHADSTKLTVYVSLTNLIGSYIDLIYSYPERQVCK